MDNLLSPGSQDTLNPLWLSAWAEWSLPNGGAVDGLSTPSPAERTSTPIKSVDRDTEAVTRPLAAPRAIFSRLSRISSDCDLEGDPLLKRNYSYHEEMREEFEKSFRDGPPPSSRRTRHLSHHGYFRRQILSGADVFIPLDPEATGSVGTSNVGEAFVDKAGASIYDAYLLRVDIAKNVNSFHRHQVCWPWFHLALRLSRVGVCLVTAAQDHE